MRKLDKDGIYIEEMQRHFYGTVAVWLRDNLGSHAIGGFLESFSGSATSWAVLILQWDKRNDAVVLRYVKIHYPYTR